MSDGPERGARRRARRIEHPGRRRPRRDHARRHVGPGPARRDRFAARHRSDPQGRPRPARPDREPPPHAGRRPHVRVLQRRPRTVRRVGRGLHQGRPVARRRRHGQALRVQRHRDRADERRRARRRANPARAVPAPVRDRRQGRRRVGRDERVQPTRRRVLRREPSTAHHRAARRMGLRRSRRVRLVRRPSHRAGGQRRPRRRDAGARPGLRFGALRRGGHAARCPRPRSIGWCVGLLELANRVRADERVPGVEESLDDPRRAGADATSGDRRHRPAAQRPGGRRRRHDVAGAAVRRRARSRRSPIVGPNAAIDRCMGGGSASLTPFHRRTLVAAVTDRIGPGTATNAHVVFEPGVRIDRLTPTVGKAQLRQPNDAAGPHRVVRQRHRLGR